MHLGSLYCCYKENCRPPCSSFSRCRKQKEYVPVFVSVFLCGHNLSHTEERSRCRNKW